jgi:hypothetical protein
MRRSFKVFATALFLCAGAQATITSYTTLATWQAAATPLGGSQTSVSLSSLPGNSTSTSSASVGGVTFTGNLRECSPAFPGSCATSGSGTSYIVGSPSITAAPPVTVNVSAFAADFAAYYGNAPQNLSITATTFSGASLNVNINPVNSITFVGFVSSDPTDPIQNVVFNELNSLNYAAIIDAYYYSAAYAPLSVTTSSPLPSATVQTGYNTTVSGSGGSSAANYSFAANGLPAGLTMSSGGTISGTPNTVGVSIPVSILMGDIRTSARTAKQYYLTVKSKAQSGFQTVSTYNAFGNASIQIATGDFNNDGVPDVAVANYGLNNVTVMLGTFGGGFGTPTTYNVGSRPYAIAAGDVTGDGQVDLVVANNQDSTISVLIGNGNGTFQTQRTYPTGSGTLPAGVALGDFDADGYLDVAVTNDSAAGGVIILLNTGTGAFGAPNTFGTGANPVGIAAGDFNGDGKPDLVIANYFSSPHTISVLINAGSGRFGAPQNYSTDTAAGVLGTNPISVAVADFNGDGKLDIVSANYGSNNLSVFLNSGTGTFPANATVYSLPGSPSPYYVAAGDFNGDGFADLAVAGYNDSSVNVLLNSGTGTFGAATTYSTGTTGSSQASGLVIGDFNGDGATDIAISNYTAGSVSLLLSVVPSSTSLLLAPNPSVYGQSVTLTATVAPGTAQGTVTFKDNGVQIGSPVLLDFTNTAKLVTSALATGPHLLTAVYNGNAGYSSSTSTSVAQQVNQNVSTGTLTSSLNPSLSGQSVTFTAAISATVGSAVPTGQVQFKDGLTVLSTQTLNASGVATYITSTLSPGSHSLIVAYGGDTNFTATNTSSLAQTVNQITTTTTVSSSQNPAPQESSITFTAQVSPATAGLYPSGTVTFLDSSQPFGAASVNTSTGIATFTTAFGFGTHSITASYGGDANNAASTSSALSQSILLPTSTSLAASHNPAPVNQSITLTAYVSGGETPSGTVTFYDGAAQVGGPATLASGQASVNVSFSTLGTHSLTAVYSGDSSYLGSTSPVVSESILNPPVVTFTYSRTSSLFGQPVTFTASISPTSATGKVIFYDGATLLGAGTVSNGQAIVVTPLLAPGTRHVRAFYTGDNNVPYGQSPLANINVSATPQQGFGAPATKTIGPNTYGLAIADFNGDGKDDIVVTSFNTSVTPPTQKVSVLIGQGNGQFLPSVDTDPTVPAFSVTAGDLNGDGIADIVLATPSGGPTIMYGTGNGSFGAPQFYSLLNVFSTAIADLNGDGFPDIALATSNGTIAWMMNNPQSPGTFAVPQSIGTVTASDPIVAVADVDGDGNPDIIATDGQGGFYGASVFFATGNGLFQSTQSFYSTGTAQPFSVMTADLNNDGRPDVIVSTTLSGVSVLVNSASASCPTTPATCFQPGASYPTGGAAATGIVTGDFNGDGRTDVAALDISASNVYILPGGGDGTLGAGTPYPAGGNGYAIATGNFGGGSGLADLAVSFGQNGDVAVLSGNIALPPTTTSLTSSINPSAFTQSTVLTATVSQSTATGTVTFFDNVQIPLGAPVNVVNGVATLSVSGLAVGSHSLTAIYSGDTNWAGSTSSSLPQIVNQATSSVTLSSSLNPSQLGQGVSFTAQVNLGATGTVTFKDGATQLGSPVTLSGGSPNIATFPISTLTVGAHSITAVYSGDPNFAGNTSSVFPQTVNPQTTTTTLGAVPASSTYGNSVTLTATVSVSSATGTVTFKDGTNVLGSSSLSTGTPNTATFTTAALTGGTRSLTAVYSGDTNDATSTSSVLSFTVNKATSITSLSSSLNPSQFSQQVTFTATVTSGATGTVTFMDGATALGSPVTLSGGTPNTATLAISNLTVATHSITAVYNGDTNYNTSTSGAVNQVVNQLTTTTSLSALPASSTYGTSVTFTATVSIAAATGTVTFKDGTNILGSSSLSTGAPNTATFATSGLTAGTHSITAVYNGDTNDATSTSSILSFGVAQASGTTTLLSSLNPSQFSQQVTFTATVPSGATGTVTFKDGATVLGSPVNVAAGQATLQVSTLSVATHSMSASYSGDTNFTSGTSNSVNQVVNPLATTTSVSGLPASPAYGTSVTFTATITGSNPTGSVTFFDGPNSMGPGTVTSGQATFTTASLTAGTHSITAAYGGDTNNTSSTSSALNFTVSKATPSISFTSNNNPAAYQQSITLTAGFVPTSATGTVTFADGAVTLGTSTVTSGTAQWPIPAGLAVGAHSLTATYSGDSNYLTTTGNLTQNVNKAASTTSLGNTPATSTFGQLVALTANVTPGATGTVTFFDGSTSLGGVTFTSSPVTLTVSSLAIGSHSVTAVYSGDTNFQTSTSTAVTQTVGQGASITSLSTSQNPSVAGQSVTLTAVVNPIGATGTIIFQDGQTVLGKPVTVNNGIASFTTGPLAPGAHPLTATYSGDSNYIGSTSTGLGTFINFANPAPGTIADSAGKPGGFTARLPGTGTALPASDPNLTVNGGAGTLTLVSTASDLNGQVNLGNAEFLGMPLASVGIGPSADFSLVARFDNVQLSQSFDQFGLFVGSDSTTAFRGGGLVSGSPESFTAQTQSGTDGNLQPDVAHAPSQGDSVVYTLSRTAGTWSFGVNNLTNPSASGTVPVAQPAYLAGLSNLVAGVFAGNPGGTSKTETISSFSLVVPVQNVIQVATSTTLTSSANPASFGQPITFTATVTPSAATGTVNLLDGATQIGTGTLSSGTIQFPAIRSLSLGSHSITATYVGDTNDAGSTSAVLPQSVGQAATATTLTSSAASTQVGQSVTLTATVSPSVATGSVRFMDGSNVLGTATLNNGVATLGTTFGFGNHSLTAVYLGDASYLTSTSGPISESATYPPLSLNSQTLPSGQVGVLYGPVSFATSGGSNNFAWSATGLPAGLSVGGGQLGGTPTATFSGSITVTVSDKTTGFSASQSYALVIASSLQITGVSDLGGVVAGSPISGSFTASGGTSPYTYSLSGAPGGFAIDSTGHLTGTTGVPGNYNFTVSVADASKSTASLAVKFTAFGIVTTTVPNGDTTKDYAGSITVAGGTAPYTFTASGLPDGITFSAGNFGGHPTTPGSYTVAVHVSDSKGLTVSASYTVNVTGPGPLQVITLTLPDGIAGQPYSQGLVASGGVSGYAWVQSGGAAPTGLSLSGSGTVLGLPTAPGTYTVGVEVTDLSGARVVAAVQINIKPAPITITSGSDLPAGIAGLDYPGQLLTADGGTAPYTFTLKGSLPPGLTLNNGQISGTPTTAGTFGFTIIATDSATTPLSGSLDVSITIRPASPDLVLSAGSALFSLTSGTSDAPAPNSITVSSSSVGQEITYTYATSTPWITVSGGTTTPATLSVGLNSAALTLASSGSPYSGSVTLTCTAIVCSGKTQTIKLNLTVADKPTQLSVDTQLLSFTAQASNPSASQNSFNITNAGGGTLAITGVSAADSWLTVGVFPATIKPGPGASVTVTANPGTLKPGFYTSSITVISSAGTATISVTLLISANFTMSLGPAGSQYSMPQGGALGNSSGSFLVSVASASPVNINATMLPGATWLTGGGSAVASSNSSAQINYALDPVAIKALPVGAYYGTIQVSGSGIVNSPQVFQVVLSISPAATPVVPDPQPAGLIFLSATPGAQPSQPIQVFASSTTPLPFQASASTSDGSGWLKISPTTGSAVAGGPGQVSVSVDSTGLKPGVYRGSVNFASGTAVRTVNITLVVEQPLTPAASPSTTTTGRLHSADTSAVCSGGKLVATQTGLVSNFAAPAAWPTPIEITLVDTCGSIIGSGTIVATFSNGDPPMQLSPVDVSKGRYSATWTPRKTAAQTVITARATAAGYDATTVQISGKVTPNTAPTLAPNGTYDVFHPQTGGGLGPGNIVQIYGTGLAGQPISANTLPLPTEVGGTQVLIGGVQSPLFYVSPGQVNAQIPFELTAGQQYQVIVSANGALTAPQPIQLNAGTPAILQFTSGAIVAQHSADGSLVSDGSPAAPGETLVLYLSGLGVTDVAVPTGAPSPSSPLANVVDQPALTLNGAPTPILFAGLTPGLVGLYQINVTLPAGLADGNYEVGVSQSGVVSNTTLLPVKTPAQ